jgi:hypothetical protein
LSGEDPVPVYPPPELPEFDPVLIQVFEVGLLIAPDSSIAAILTIN